MATYMTQFSYSTASIKAMVDTPQDRRAAAEKIFGAAGGTIKAMYFCFGDYDGVAIADFPSHIDAASALLAASSTGAFSALKTSQLIEMDDGIKAMEKAKAIVGSFTPPAG